MRKLMIAVIAAALAQAGFAANSWINQPCDIATTDQIDPTQSQWFLSQGGATTFTLSKDFTLTHGQFYAQSVLKYNNWYASCIYDFSNGNHVLTVNPGFFVYGYYEDATISPEHQNDFYMSHEFRGGTWDMNGKELTFGGYNNGHQCDHMVIIADGTTFRNISEATLLEKSYDSKVTFKNGAMLGNESALESSSVTVFKPRSGTDDNNEVRFESGAKMNCLFFRDSYAPSITDAATRKKDWNLQTVITGEGTEMNVAGETHFSQCLGGLTTIIDNKAVFNGAPNTYSVLFGCDSNVGGGTLIINNGAQLNATSFKMGYTNPMVENMTLKLGNGAEMHIAGEFGNACKSSSIEISSGAKLTCAEFKDSYNYAGLDETTLSQDWNLTTTVTGEGSEIKATGDVLFSNRFGGLTTVIDDKAVVTSGGYAAIFGNNLTAHNGTLIIDNGAKLNAQRFEMGLTSRMMENMTLRVGNGAEMNIVGTFMSAGKGNSLEINNGTISANAVYFGHEEGAIVSSDYSLTFRGENPRIISQSSAQIKHAHVTFELIPGHTYTEPFITGKGEAFISFGSSIEFENAEEYCKQLTAPVDIALIHDATSNKAECNYTAISGLPDGAKVNCSADGKYVYLHLEPFCAKVGDKSYASIEAAISAVEDGGTIEMLRDVTLDKAGMFGAKDNLTLDLAGHTLSWASGDFYFTNGGATTFTLKNSAESGGVFSLNGNWLVGGGSGTEGSTVIIDKGVTVDLHGNSIVEGRDCGNQLIYVKEGGKITTTTGAGYIFVGDKGVNSRLLIEGTVDVSYVKLGFSSDSTGSKVVVKGSNAKFIQRDKPISPLISMYFNPDSIDGEIVYDNCNIDESGKDFYWHGKNVDKSTGNQLTLVNGAKVKFANIYMGREGSTSEACVPAVGQRIFIGENSTLEVGTQLMMTGYGNTLTIDNGTFLADSNYAFYWGHTSAQTTCEIKDNSIIIVGEKAKLRSKDSDNAQFIIHGSTVTFDLSKGIYEEAPIKGKDIKICDDNTVVFAGIDQVRAYLEANSLESVDIPLMQSSTADYCFFFETDAKRAALNATLPAGVKVVMNGNKSAAFLHVEPIPAEFKTQRFADWLSENGLTDSDNPCANGLTARQSYVLGLNPNDATSKPQIAKGDNGKFRFGIDPDSGATVSLQVQKSSDGTSFSDFGTAQNNSVEIAPTEVSAGETAYYRVKIDLGNGLFTDQILGVINVANSANPAAIGVSWGKMGAGEVSVEDVLVTSALSAGDIIYVYGQNAYQAWKWSGSAWVAISTVTKEAITSAAASSVSLPRGSAFWLERVNLTKPIIIAGRYDTAGTTTTIETGWNLIASPKAASFDINAVVGGNINASDQILVPTAGAPIVYTYADGAWGRIVTSVSEIGGHKVVETSRSTENATVPAGHGFWYISAGGNTPTFNW